MTSAKDKFICNYLTVLYDNWYYFTIFVTTFWIWVLFFRNILYLQSKQAWENAPKSKQVHKPAKKKKNKKKQTQK